MNSDGDLVEERGGMGGGGGETFSLRGTSGGERKNWRYGCRPRKGSFVGPMGENW